MPQLRYLCCKAVIVVKTPEPCVPDFSFRPPCHTSSLLYEDCCRTSVCANHPTVRKGCSLLLLSRGELIAQSLFVPLFTEVRGRGFSEVGVGHPRGGSYPLLDKRCSHPRLI